MTITQVANPVAATTRGLNAVNRVAAVMATFAMLLTFAAPQADAQSYPNRPLRFVVGNPPGGTTDLMARILADRLKDRIGQPVVIETRAGAASLLAIDYVAKQPADGYTFVVASSSIATMPTLNPNAGYNPARDFTPVAGIAIAPFLVMVRGDFPAQNLGEFVAYAKANPGKINVGAAGNGSFDHLAGTAFVLKSNTKMTWIAYKGEAAAVADLVGGRVDASFLQWGTSGPHILAGKIRVLASMSAARVPTLPNVPTAAEAGTPVEAAAWFAMFGPAGLPKEVVDLLSRESTAILRQPEAAERIRAVNQQPMILTPEQLGALLRKSTEDWAAVIKAADLKVQ